ncbi:MAG TPA: ribbon-helix-helix domain-containing protein [Candidatus Solibacter sp.]|nr:ribbon-helix-helix domain-containing protein [Candidatus Solibacter sp.]
MAAKKITITLPDHQLAEIRKRVTARKTETVSGFIRHTIQELFDNEAAFGAMVDEVLEKTGGPLTAKERAWARKMLTPRKPGTKSRKAPAGRVRRRSQTLMS